MKELSIEQKIKLLEQMNELIEETNNALFRAFNKTSKFNKNMKYGKLMIDGKMAYVFEFDTMPNWIERLSHFKGIEIQDATYEEREKFDELERVEKAKKVKIFNGE